MHSRELSRNGTAFEEAIRTLGEHISRLGFAGNNYKFADGFSAYYRLLADIHSEKLPRNINLINKFSQELQVLTGNIKQDTLAKKLKTFVENYRNVALYQTSSTVVNVRGNVQTRLEVGGLINKYNQSNSRDYRVLHGYRTLLDINPKDSEGKILERNKILDFFEKNEIFLAEELVFLRNPLNFNTFVRGIIPY